MKKEKLKKPEVCDACGQAFFENEIVFICEKDGAVVHGDIYNKCWLLHLEKEHDIPKKIEVVFEQGRILSKEDEEVPEYTKIYYT